MYIPDINITNQNLGLERLKFCHYQLHVLTNEGSGHNLV